MGAALSVATLYTSTPYDRPFRPGTAYRICLIRTIVTIGNLSLELEPKTKRSSWRGRGTHTKTRRHKVMGGMGFVTLCLRVRPKDASTDIERGSYSRPVISNAEKERRPRRPPFVPDSRPTAGCLPWCDHARHVWHRAAPGRRPRKEGAPPRRPRRRQIRHSA